MRVEFCPRVGWNVSGKATLTAYRRCLPTPARRIHRLGSAPRSRAAPPASSPQETPVARTFNPPPNWPKPPEGWEAPPGWQPDPAWGPAPQGWQLWVDDEDTGDTVRDERSGAGAAGAVGAEGAAVSSPGPAQQGAGPSAPSAPRYQAHGQTGPTAQVSGVSGPPAYQGSSYQDSSYRGPGGPPTGPSGSSGGGAGGSKLIWIMGGGILLLILLVIALILAVTGVIGGGRQNPDPAAVPPPQQQESQPQDSGQAGDGEQSTQEPAEEANRVNVEPADAASVQLQGDPAETFTQDDGDIDLPYPDGEDAPVLVTMQSTGEGYAYLDAVRADGSETVVGGASGNEIAMDLLNADSYERDNPIETVRAAEDDMDFELKVYRMDQVPEVDGNVAGDGPGVFRLSVDDSSQWYRMSHNGSSNFIVYAMNDYGDGTYDIPELASNEIGRTVVYTEYGEGDWVVTVDADGRWGFEESTEDMAKEAAITKIREG